MPLHNVSSSQKPGDHWDQTLAANISLTQGTLLNLQTKALWLYTLQIPANVHICRLLRRVALIFVALSWCEWFEEIGTDLNSNRITVHDTTLILRPSVRSRGWMQRRGELRGVGPEKHVQCVHRSDGSNTCVPLTLLCLCPSVYSILSESTEKQAMTAAFCSLGHDSLQWRKLCQTLSFPGCCCARRTTSFVLPLAAITPLCFDAEQQIRNLVRTQESCFFSLCS